MIRNYLKIAFRSLWRSKGHASINIIGLSLGAGCCILIALYVNDELTFDKFNSKAGRIYRVFGSENIGGRQDLSSVTPFPMGPALKQNIPEVESYVRFLKLGTQVKVGTDQFNEDLAIGDHNIFEMFDFELTGGDRKSVLAAQNNIVLDEQIATKYFGKSDPINKTISIQLLDKFEEFVVTGVAKIPANSGIQFHLLISDENLPKLFSERALTSAWFNVIPETYVLLREGVNPKVVSDKFPALFKGLLGEEKFRESNYSPGLQPLTDIHLNVNFPAGQTPVSNPRYSYILSAIALLILVVACINFITLSIGRSLKRAKEVGIRKVVGAVKRQLVIQFIGEAMIVTMFSLITGLVLAALTLPVFNDLAGKKLVLPFDFFMASVLSILLVSIGLIAGSYPAFILSGFRPIVILKGIQVGSSKQRLRKILVGVQLVLSVFLVSSTLVMRNQLDYLLNKDLGFNKSQVTVIPINVVSSGRLSERMMKGFEKAETIKSALQKVPDITAMCTSSHDFGNGAWTNVGFTDDAGVYRTFNLNVIDDEYISTLNIQFVAGRNYEKGNLSDKRRGVVVNEAFVRMFGWTDALASRIPGQKFGDHEIIGVVKDFNYTSLYTSVPPLVMVQDPKIILSGIENVNIDNSPVPKVFVRIRPGKIQTTMDMIQNVWENVTAGEEFNYSFLDESLKAQYQNDQNLGRIVSIATILSIIIGSLGLYGLASLTMQSRVREISIRKVLGATGESILILMSKDFVYLNIVSLLISVPITLYLMTGWLSTFEYHIDISWKVFAIAGGIALTVAMITISYQALKASWTQPAETLKHE